MPPEELFDPEFARVLRISHPGAAFDVPLTFLPPRGAAPAAWLQAWETWREQVLAVAIAPVLSAAASHARQGAAREIQALNLGLSAALDPAAAARSAVAGALLLRRLSAARGERWLGRLQAWAAAGEAAAHFPVIYAAQYMLFHLPLRLLLPSYAYLEWTVAGGAAPDFAAAAARLPSLIFPDHAVDHPRPAASAS